MKKPIIGIIGRAEVTNEEDPVICVHEKVRRAIIACGGIPILVLPPQNLIYAATRPRDCIMLTEKEKELLEESLSLCDGILMPGGSARYSYDKWICSYAVEHNMPVLGICLGMQILGEYGNKEKEIPMTEKNVTEINHRQKDSDYVHAVLIEKNTLLHDILGVEEIRVNSLHNFHIPFLHTYRVNALSEDGLIEAFEDQEKDFVLGIQWHPESMIFYDENAHKIMDAFLEAARKYQTKKRK